MFSYVRIFKFALYSYTSAALPLIYSLVHPLSPKGKLVHLGLEGLAVTNSLVKAVREHRSDCVLQEEIYRVAVNDDHVSTLKQSAERLPELTQWVEARDLPMDCPSDVLGGLRLHSGCKVINVPSYLEGLWEVIRFTGTGWREWRVLQPSSDDVDWVNELKDFDTVVLSAGSGLFQDAIISEELPMQLVRGQSIEMTLNKEKCDFAMLCGKYISPLLEPSRILIGATHEFKEVPLDRRQVYSELRERSDAFASNLWEDGVVDNITSGVRVQSNRGPYGRLPMIGNFKSSLHSNAWIFTGLSSRGLIYHGLFGEILASRILNLETEYEQSGLDWWRNN